MSDATPIEILLVEDNPADARLTREALREGCVANHLHHVVDGIEALAFLRREGKYADAPPADIILLDLNLPRMDGREVLGELKQDPKLHLIPVVVLTTSEAEQDILRSYELHANCYITKPVDLDKFFKIVRTIEEFWLAIIKLPGRQSVGRA
jgi:chemotaxis family two-component system response regulator Rcp1